MVVYYREGKEPRIKMLSISRNRMKDIKYELDKMDKVMVKEDL